MLAALVKAWNSCSMESVVWYALSPLRLILPAPAPAVLPRFFFSQLGTWNAELERLRYPPPPLLSENVWDTNTREWCDGWMNGGNKNIIFSGLYLLLVLVEDVRPSDLDLVAFVACDCWSIGGACSLVPALPTTLHIIETNKIFVAWNDKHPMDRVMFSLCMQRQYCQRCLPKSL